MANNSISLATLDAGVIKENLKNHLKNQSIFKDYDFEGSNMNVLLDILAYNTSLQAFYMNMLSAESFLDSAQMRSSVISHAKELNYTPRSVRSAKAVISIKLEQNNSDTFILPKGTTFTSTYNFQTYTFTVNETKSYYSVLDNASGTYKFNTGDIEIYEGFYVTETFTMNYADESLRFIMSNANIDTSSIIVNSIEDGGSTIVNYTYSDTLLGLNGNSRKYFLQVTEQEKYEIVFGDDIIGRKPADNSIITIQYRVSSGTAPNGATSFTIDNDLTSDNSGRIEVTTVFKAIGGDEPESITSIKYNAPRHFQTQESAITSSDYKNILRTKYPEISAISVYGGETVSPPQYGRVFISLSIADVDGLPMSKIQEYTNYIKPKMPSPIQPVFIEPTYLYAKVIANVKYNLNTTILKLDEIRMLVADSINSYNIRNINDFNSTLYESRLTESINNSHESIISNITDVYLYKKINASVGKSSNYNIVYGVPLRDDIPEIAPNHLSSELRTVYSSTFMFNGTPAILEDDGVGNIRIVSTNGNTNMMIKNVGTVDYSKGTIQITNLYIDSYSGQSLRIYALPVHRDITSAMNDIFRIEQAETIINVEAVRE